jgi:hypothetical protein
MNEEFEIFEGMVSAAASRISTPYFQLPVAGLEDSVYRERVYCYELYHQLRCGWNGFDFNLGGEVDKGGHPLFRDGPYAKAKPDLLVHRPGDMEHNLACVEVKPSLRPAGEFNEDMRKLTWFCRNARYHRGLFLVYGAEQHEGQNLDLFRKLRKAADDREIDLGSIRLMHHASVGQPAVRVDL